MAGFIESLACVFPTSKVIDGFRGGKGPQSEDYPPEHWEGIERSTAPSYRNLLTKSYLPAMPDIAARLRQGGATLDLGCGGGVASIAIAKAFPKAEVFGYDVFAPSIEKAKKNATAAGLSARIRFATYDGIHLPADRFDLVTICYAVHHFRNPIEILESTGKSLRKGGSVLVMEANVPERIENSIGNTWANWNYGVSLFYCMSAVVTEGGPSYGTAIKESEIRALAEKSGFRHFRHLPVNNPIDALYELKLA
jgi:2-polyprenyl-3-methyl-5-hydroxy-6-metoxy-1,4-benzoquinol methylase